MSVSNCIGLMYLEVPVDLASYVASVAGGRSSRKERSFRSCCQTAAGPSQGLFCARKLLFCITTIPPQAGGTMASPSRPAADRRCQQAIHQYFRHQKPSEVVDQAILSEPAAFCIGSSSVVPYRLIAPCYFSAKECELSK